MNIAIVVDDLIQKGGQENLVKAISEIWPEAPIYTSIASEDWIKYFNSKKVAVITSFMQNLPFVTKLSRYYFILNFFQLAFESFDFSEFDIVLSISARYAHTIITKPTTTHICYMNTPGRMFWEPKDYFKYESYGSLNPFKKFADSFLKLPLLYSRIYDFVSSNRMDFIISNSITAHDRVTKYYNKSSDIIYPFADTEKFHQSNKPNDAVYFLVITRLLPWKRVDIAIQACLDLGLPLKVAGEGPDLMRLKTLAGKSTKIEFLGYVSDVKKVDLLQNCSALINTQFEDFGIVPVEAMAAGKPVIAYAKGGVLETVISGTNGLYFSEQTPDSLAGILKNFDPTKFDPEICRARAELFSKNVFVNSLRSFVNSKYSIL